MKRNNIGYTIIQFKAHPYPNRNGNEPGGTFLEVYLLIIYFPDEWIRTDLTQLSWDVKVIKHTPRCCDVIVKPD
jgi:hypothetical protein